MRDIGLFVWVVLLIVGVVGSMTSSIRRQREQAARRADGSAPAPPQPMPGLPPGQSAQQASVVRVMQSIAAQQGIPPAAQRPARPASRPAPAPPTPQALPHSVAAPLPRPKQRGLFGTGPELVRAVIAAEVLGKPRALRDEYY